MLGTLQRPDSAVWITLAEPGRTGIRCVHRPYISAGLDWDSETQSMFWNGRYFDLDTEAVEPHVLASAALYYFLGELEKTGNCDFRLTAEAPFPVTREFDLSVVPFSSSLELLRSTLRRDRGHFDVSYTMAGRCIILAANGGVCCENDMMWWNTDVYVLPVCSASEETVQCCSVIELDRYFDIESGCRYVDMEINLRFDGVEETVRVPLCLYADVYRPSALPLSTAPYSGQIDYMFRLALAYRSMALRSGPSYFQEDVASLIDTAGLARGHGVKYWYDPEQIRHQLVSGIAEWESTSGTPEAFSEIIDGPVTLTRYKLSILFDMEIASILSGTGCGIITREGWRPALNIPRLASVARRYWMRKHNLPHTVLEDGYTVLFLTKADAEKPWSGLIWDNDTTVVLVLKRCRPVPVRPVMTLKDLKAMLAQYGDDITYPEMPEAPGGTLEQDLYSLLEGDNIGRYKLMFETIYRRTLTESCQRMVTRTLEYFKHIL